jgi:hypothetical protein
MRSPARVAPFEPAQGLVYNGLDSHRAISRDALPASLKGPP